MRHKNFWVYADVHHHVDAAQQFLERKNPAKVIWLGDFMDGFGDSPMEAEKTGRWLKKTMLGRPQDVFIQSNHDIAYRFPQTDKYKICGWNLEKHKAFHRVFPEELWGRFVIAHLEEWNSQKVLFSHAGFTDIFFPFGKFDFQHLKRIEKIAFDNAHRVDYNPLLDNYHGPLWIRWQALPLLEGVCQVVGHTNFEEPQIRAVAGRPEWNLDVDCVKNYYIVFKKTHAYAIDRNKGYQHLLNFKAPETPKYEVTYDGE